MSKGTMQKVMLIGFLGKDPEIKYMPNGQAVANVTIATTESWKDKATGATQEKTEWHKVVFFKRLAEVVGAYLKKGAKIYVEGRLQTRKWQDKQGQDRYSTEIVANEMQMLGGGAAHQTPAATAAESIANDTDFAQDIPGFDDDFPVNF